MIAYWPFWNRSQNDLSIFPALLSGSVCARMYDFVFAVRVKCVRSVMVSVCCRRSAGWGAGGRHHGAASEPSARCPQQGCPAEGAERAERACRAGQGSRPEWGPLWAAAGRTPGWRSPATAKRTAAVTTCLRQRQPRAAAPAPTTAPAAPAAPGCRPGGAALPYHAGSLAPIRQLRVEDLACSQHGGPRGLRDHPSANSRWKDQTFR